MKDYELVKENIEHIEGIYVIFCPFIPCLFWSLIVRAKAMNGVISEKSKSDWDLESVVVSLLQDAISAS